MQISFKIEIIRIFKEMVCVMEKSVAEQFKVPVTILKVHFEKQRCN